MAKYTAAALKREHEAAKEEVRLLTAQCDRLRRAQEPTKILRAVLTEARSRRQALALRVGVFT